MKKWLTTLLLLIGLIKPINATDKNDPNSEKTTTNTYPEHGIFTGEQKSNLISNAGFENRTSSWTLGKFNGGTGLFTTDTIHQISGEQSALVITENTTQDYTDVQLFTFFQISGQTRYSISFQAEVANTNLVSLTVGNGFETFFEEKFLLRPEQKLYGPFNFKSSKDDQFTFLAFNLGKTKGELRFDDVVIQADYTDKKFNQILANTGINLWPVDKYREFYLQLPTVATEDYPVVFLNEHGKTVKMDKISQGIQEKQFYLNENFEKGSYTLKVFTPYKTLAYNFELE